MISTLNGLGLEVVDAMPHVSTLIPLKKRRKTTLIKLIRFSWIVMEFIFKKKQKKTGGPVDPRRQRVRHHRQTGPPAGAGRDEPVAAGRRCRRRRRRDARRRRRRRRPAPLPLPHERVAQRPTPNAIRRSKGEKKTNKQRNNNQNSETRTFVIYKDDLIESDSQSLHFMVPFKLNIAIEFVHFLSSIHLL